MHQTSTHWKPGEFTRGAGGRPAKHSGRKKQVVGYGYQVTTTTNRGGYLVQVQVVTRMRSSTRHLVVVSVVGSCDLEALSSFVRESRAWVDWCKESKPKLNLNNRALQWHGLRKDFEGADTTGRDPESSGPSAFWGEHGHKKGSFIATLSPHKSISSTCWPIARLIVAISRVDTCPCIHVSKKKQIWSYRLYTPLV